MKGDNIMGIPISLNGIRGDEGWLLAEPIRNYFGQTLCPADKLLDTTTIDLLKKHYIKLNKPIKDIVVHVKFQSKTLTDKQKELMENIQKQNCDIPSFISPELQIKTIVALKEAYNPSEGNLKNALKVVDECLDDLAQRIQTQSEFSYSLGQYKYPLSMTNVLEHALRVAQFSVVLADIYNKQLSTTDQRISLQSIGTAALLHDYGTCFEDKKEMRKLSLYQLGESFIKTYPNIPSDLLQQPYNEKYKNVYAYAALKNFLDSPTLNTILLSGESENGKGLNCLNIVNRKTTSSAMAAKIIFLCNLYDSLLKRTLETDASLENVSTTLEMLVKNGVIHNQLGNLFLNNIPLYSVGVRVLLSTGEYATVVERFTGTDATKPIVQTLVNPPLRSTTIDLRNTTNITIAKIVGSNELLDQKIKEITDWQLKSMEITSIPLETRDNDMERRTRAI